ncbi:SH3 and multiple ankyrin repeat domains protein 2-like isoform X2 [Erinaceus europaeus]|uniref:SH3 and multiple ankyrin repeat domains protein 2-like isoform X2 n=1 Tax=Erinaceus europaeus TaxID=9365 RepID=A0ABM3W9L6_ERIEU|nr:SH3 and multiple ankyrin repeat domains protein 2-like isoform X2 [Erinaceus europaeus]
MAQSFSDDSAGFGSESSEEGTVYDTIQAARGGPGPAPSQHSPGSTVVIRVFIHDLQQTKCLRFDLDSTVWVAKQRVLCSLTQSLPDALNYGLFQPPSHGRDGKFLDEERLLREYPQPEGPGVPALEGDLRRCMELVQRWAVDRVAKMLERGLDPNFHDLDTGETPLTLAAQLDQPAEMLKALRNGGAHLDFRARDGMTALHRAARARNPAALKTLLELGASPDYKDSCGLTPLYHTAVVGGDPQCCELLLRDWAVVGCRDDNGWTELHQACRYGHVQQLEHLLFYGADMGAQNASGNTALHICALYNQDSCARVLLFRGGDKDLKNYNSQTPFQVAIIAGNFELAEYIKNHKETNVVPLVPPRRTVPAPGAPPPSPRSPTGLLPPTPGWHRTHSGEHAQQTSSREGELRGDAPSVTPGPACSVPWGLCVSCLRPLPRPRGRRLAVPFLSEHRGPPPPDADGSPSPALMAPRGFED